MALRQIMLSRKIAKIREELKEVEDQEKDLDKKEKNLEKAIDEADSEEEEEAVAAEVDEFEKAKNELEEKKVTLEEELAKVEEELAKIEEVPEAPEKDPELSGRNKRSKGVKTMQIRTNIRELPINKRALDSLDFGERTALMERYDVKDFLKRVRDMKGSTRAISGGELAIPTVMLDLIAENMYRYSRLLNRVRVREVKGEARQTIAGTVPEAIWTEMVGNINELTFVFNQVVLDGYKVAGFVPVANSILEDSDIDLASWLVEMLSESIGIAEDKAILYGKGASEHMPLGIVTRLAQTAKPSGYPANAPAWTDLHTTNLIKVDGSKSGADFWADLTIACGNTFTKYSRGEQFFAMNSKTYAALKSKLITFTAGGDMVANLFGTLPVVNGNIDILEFMPDGDIVGGYGDLYLFVDRGAMQIDVSDQVQFIQDNTVFRGKARVDGTPVVPSAFVAININNVDVTTALDFAADTSNECSIKSLKIGSETLTPTFSADVTSYAVAATGTSGKVDVVANDGAVIIDYDGVAVKNGGTITFKTGSHPLTITVKNGAAVKVYTVTVTR